MKEITQVDFSSAVEKGVTVVDFFATRCGPCKMVAPYLEEMEGKLNGAVQFLKVNVDAEPGLAQEYGVTAMPTFKVMKDGQVVHTIVGADLKDLWQAIKAAMGEGESAEAKVVDMGQKKAAA